MPRLPDRLQALERAARSVDGELVVIECQGQPTAAQIGEWEAAAKVAAGCSSQGPGSIGDGCSALACAHPWEPLR